ncbi:MAG: hypothetical protein BYD32DRAFT_40228 [Podila humilis]|nr:MAG: hypothetical protein BYD32DRAFT_40228 [Podila humilis]
MSIHRRVSYGILFLSQFSLAISKVARSETESKDGGCLCLSDLGMRMSLGQTGVRSVLMKEARSHPVCVQQSTEQVEKPRVEVRSNGAPPRWLH